METNQTQCERIIGTAAPLCMLGLFIGGGIWIHGACNEHEIQEEKESQESFLIASGDVISIFEKHYPNHEGMSEGSPLESYSMLDVALKAKKALNCLEEILAYDSQQPESESNIFLYNNEIVNYDLSYIIKNKTVTDYTPNDFHEINQSFSRTEFVKQSLLNEILDSAELLAKKSKGLDFGNNQGIDVSIFNIATQLKVIANRVKNEEQYISNNVIHHTYKTGSSETPIGIVGDFQNCQAGLDILISYLKD